MKRKDIKSMTLNEVRQYIVSNLRFAHQQNDLMLMYYDDLYAIYLKYFLPASYFYKLAHEIFDYVNREKDVDGMSSPHTH